MLRYAVLSALLLSCASAPEPGSPTSADASVPPVDAGSQGTSDGGAMRAALCHGAAPAGAPEPEAPPSYSGGTCPALTPGLNLLTSTGHMRQFLLIAPAHSQPGEELPLFFVWHGVGDEVMPFAADFDLQTAADQQRFLAVLPVAEGATFFGFELRWPFDIAQSTERMEEEYRFFDDMLACVAQQFHVRTSCVSTIGFSAGALFSAQLAQARSTRLASLISLSGGVGGSIARSWSGATHKLPALVLWGGDGPPTQDGVRDSYGCFGVTVDFPATSRELEMHLVQEGHFLLECVHNCGHTEPPFQSAPTESKYADLWRVVLDHPYWLSPGESPYRSEPLPAAMTSWCGIGAGSATPRHGPGCPPADTGCLR